MIHTFRVPFSHDSHTAFESFGAFADLVAKSLCLPSAHLWQSPKPLVTYATPRQEKWDTLRSLLEANANALIYLCDIESYATVLLQSAKEVDIPDHQTFATYTSYDQLMTTPRMTGYSVPDPTATPVHTPGTYTLLGQVPLFAQTEDNEPNPDWFHVVRKERLKHITGPVYAYQLKNTSEGLNAAACWDEPTYVLPDLKTVGLDQCFPRYNCFHDDLTQYLLSRSVPFATLNDGHWDDCFAVSYQMDLWNFGTGYRMFVA